MFDLLAGGPGETRETLRESLDLVRRACADCVGVSMGVRVYDGTQLAEQVRAIAGGARGAYWDILRRMRGS